MADVSPIPEGMHTITPHLVCADGLAALDFYKRAFGAVQLDQNMSSGGKLLHAHLRIGNSSIMLADEFPEWDALGPNARGGASVTLHLYVENADAFMAQAEKAGATVVTPVEETFWGDRYGKLTDPFGHSWAVATHVRDVTPEEMHKAAQEMFA